MKCYISLTKELGKHTITFDNTQQKPNFCRTNRWLIYEKGTANLEFSCSHSRPRLHDPHESEIPLHSVSLHTGKSIDHFNYKLIGKEWRHNNRFQANFAALFQFHLVS